MTTEQGARRVFLGLIIISIALLALLISPFAKAFFLAAVLAGAFAGTQKRLTRILRGRGNLAAGIICVGIVLILLLPIAGLTAYIVKEVIEGVNFITSVVEEHGLAGLVDYVPGPLQGITERVLERIQVESRGLWQTLQEQISTRGATAAQTVGGVVAATGSVVIQGVMMMIALFFLLVEGSRLVDWFESVSPLKRGQTTELLYEFRSVTRAVMVSTIVTAGVQALAALAGYLIASVPAPIFFAALTFFVALIPAIGAAAVCLAAALLLLASGEPWWALFLAVWGVAVVGLADNVVKPLLVKRGMHLHGAIVFFALIGGLAVFGTIGLLIGPLIVAFFLAVVRIYERDFGQASS